jgi:hypothetical protein
MQRAMARKPRVRPAQATVGSNAPGGAVRKDAPCRWAGERQRCGGRARRTRDEHACVRIGEKADGGERKRERRDGDLIGGRAGRGSEVR